MATGSRQSGSGRKRPPLIALAGFLIAVVVAGLVIFNATRSGPNYREEQQPGPDPVETTSPAAT